MFFGFDLKEILMFPFKDQESRKYFLIGCLVALAAFFIPILPYLVLFGYAVRIARQVMNNESPRMVAWDDWSGMVKDGVKVFGIRLILVSPILILLIPLIISSIAFPIVLNSVNSSEIETVTTVFSLLIFASICCIVPLSIPLGLIIPGAEMHVIEKDDFMAGLRFKEWLPIFRANLSGFIAALAITYVVSIVVSLVIQILGATLILACLVPFLLLAMTLHLTILMFVLGAQAYKVGKEKLAQPLEDPVPVPSPAE